MTKLTTAPRAIAGITVPPGARIPIGCPIEWLTAAAAADWQCQCTTSGKGRAKETCGRSHWDEHDRRCPHRAAGACAMRLILITDVNGELRLMCEPCAAGHARTLVRNHAAKPAPEPEEIGQDSLFDLPQSGGL